MGKFLLVTLALMALAAAACDKLGNTAEGILEGPRPTVTVVLVDESRSIDPDDREIYLASVRALGTELRGGDRLLVGSIGDQTRASFRPVLDIRIRRTDVRLDQEDAVRAGQAELAREAPGLLAGENRAANTRILESVTAAGEAFRSAPDANHRLVLLTDAVEDSAVINLDQDRVGPEEVQAGLQRAREEGLIPDLSGVEISIIGAGGRDFSGVESFWRAFAPATHGNLVRYGRLPYEPAAGRGSGG